MFTDLQHLPPELEDWQRRSERVPLVHPERLFRPEKKFSGRKTDRGVRGNPVHLCQTQQRRSGQLVVDNKTLNVRQQQQKTRANILS